MTTKTTESNTTLDAAGLVRRFRETYASGQTRSFEWRDQQLDALAQMLTDGEDELVAALASDLGRPAFEAWVGDVRIIVRECHDIKKKYRKWSGDQKYILTNP
jgi:aldehyde dehydrogenase (NAD+)